MLALHRWGPRIALVIVFMGAGLRLYRLGDKNVWWDEGFTVFMARLPLAEMLNATAHDTHPPLYYALLHGWQLIAGDSELALRLPSALAGVLALAIAFRLVRALAGVPAALTAIALAAVSRVLVWYSQEIRQYMFAALLAVASLLLAYYLWRKARWVWIAYVAVTLAGLLSLYLFIGVVLAENLAAVVALAAAGQRRTALAAHWLAAQVAIAAGFAAWLFYYLPRAPHHFAVANSLDLGEVTKLYLNAVFIGNATDIDRYWPVVLGLSALLVGGAGLAARKLRPRSPAQVFGLAGLVAGAVTPPILVWLVNLPTPYQPSFAPAPRYFLVQIPWGLVVGGIALAGVATRWPRAWLLATSATLMVFGFYTTDYYGDRHRSDDYAGAAATVGAFRQPDDAVFVHNDRDWPIVAYHLGRYPMGRDWIGLNGGRQIASDADAGMVLEPAWSMHAGAWLLVTPEALVNDPDRRVLGWLTAHAVAWREFDFEPAAQLFFFARTPVRAESIDQLAASPPLLADMGFTAAPGLRLLTAVWTQTDYHTGETLHLFLYWRNEQALGNHDFAVSLRSPQGIAAEEAPASLAVTLASPALIRQQIDVPLRSYLGSGRYVLTVVARPASADIGQVDISAGSPAPALPLAGSPAHPIHLLHARFEGGVTLSGYTFQVQQGKLDLTLLWNTTEPVDVPYKMFVHLLGPTTNPATGDDNWAQWDGVPGAGPITTWRTGQPVASVLELAPPANRPPGKYQVEVGWYDGLSGQRLLVLDDSGAPIDSRARLDPFDWPNN